MPVLAKSSSVFWLIVISQLTKLSDTAMELHMVSICYVQKDSLGWFFLGASNKKKERQSQGAPPISRTPGWQICHQYGCARNYRPSFRENKPKTLVLYDWKRAFWACFHENWVYKFGHWCRWYRWQISHKYQWYQHQICRRCHIMGNGDNIGLHTP